MKAIVFNFHGSTLDRSTEAVTLKVGYLLGDEIFTAGCTSFDLFMVELQSNYPISQIFQSLEARFKNDPEQLEGVLKMKSAYKLCSKTKYKQPQFLGSYIKAEKSLRHYWITVLEEMSDLFDSLGFQQIRDIGYVAVGHYFVAEEAQFSIPGSAKASNLLQRLLPDVEEDEEPEIFFLGDEFLSDTYTKPTLYKASDKEAADTKNIYLHKCFLLPNINPLSATELQTVRTQLQQVSALFRENMDEWIEMCYFNDEVTERISFFKNHVLPAVQIVQESIYDNSILQLCNRLQNGTSQIEVWMGEMPVWHLWNFYKDHNVIKEETWDKLESLKDDEEYKDKRWPVMMLASVKEKIEQPFNGDPEKEIKSCKKYILID